MIYIIFRTIMSFYLGQLICSPSLMLSTSSKYALKAVLYLADQSNEDHKVMVKDLSKATQIPKAYLAKLLQALSRHNIVSSAKGPKGGYYLTSENKVLPLYSVVEIIDGASKIEMCILGLEQCSEKKPCALHQYISPSRELFISTLKKMTIHELSLDLKKSSSFLPL